MCPVSYIFLPMCVYALYTMLQDLVSFVHMYNCACVFITLFLSPPLSLEEMGLKCVLLCSGLCVELYVCFVCQRVRSLCVRFSFFLLSLLPLSLSMYAYWAHPTYRCSVALCFLVCSSHSSSNQCLRTRHFIIVPLCHPFLPLFFFSHFI